MKTPKPIKFGLFKKKWFNPIKTKTEQKPPGLAFLKTGVLVARFSIAYFAHYTTSLA